MRVVRAIADTGRTIVCTIHQPAIDIFEVRARRLFAESCFSRAQHAYNHFILVASCLCYCQYLLYLCSCWF